MDSQEFLQELLDIVKDFCRTLDAQPPAYCYIPLKSDEERVRVMKSRLFNELRAADLFGTWLKTTPEFEVKALLAKSAHEEMVHAELLANRITKLGYEPFDYRPLPAQTAMFNALEGLNDTCQRIAGFSLAGESVATYLTQKSLQDPHGESHCLVSPSASTKTSTACGVSSARSVKRLCGRPVRAMFGPNPASAAAVGQAGFAWAMIRRSQL